MTDTAVPKARKRRASAKPKSSDLKERMILRLSDADYEELRTAAFRERRPMSELVRDALTAYHKRAARGQARV